MGTATTSNITGGPAAGYGYVNQANSIASGTVVVSGINPPVTIDAIYYNATNGTSSAVFYLTTATGTLQQQLGPNPTGVIGSDITGTESQFGIRVADPGLGIAGATSVVIAGETSLYAFMPGNTHPQIDFTLTNGFKQGGTTTNKASFSFPAYQSQSYISSADTSHWIQIGANAPGLTYS